MDLTKTLKNEGSKNLPFNLLLLINNLFIWSCYYATNWSNCVHLFKFFKIGIWLLLHISVCLVQVEVSCKSKRNK